MCTQYFLMTAFPFYLSYLCLYITVLEKIILQRYVYVAFFFSNIHNIWNISNNQYEIQNGNNKEIGF